MTLSTPACPALVRRSTRRAHVVAVSHARYIASEDPRPPLSFRVRFIILFIFFSQFRFNNNFIFPSRVVRSLVLDAVPLIMISSSYYIERNLNRLHELRRRFIFNLFALGSSNYRFKNKKTSYSFRQIPLSCACRP